eukprot:TRINITY_DN11874_c0_g1_i1.p1 TRINITY_DN11874_c0_g1~~TRINITY_DN11874_c0_g1_i1.p1  ORF type:complete len:618 (-),score=105.28 TRINITY_DN11874_c0_g1_i1:76-1929(-)
MSMPMTVGLDFNAVTDLEETIRETLSGFDFACVPLVHPRYKRNLFRSQVREEPLTRSDLTISSQQWTSVVIGKVSPWIELESSHPVVRRNSELVFKQELAWASHLAIPAVLLPGPTSYKCYNLARLIGEAVTQLTYTQVWVRIPVSHPTNSLTDEACHAAEDDLQPSGRAANDPWEWWRFLKTSCDNHANLYCVIELTPDLPPKNVLDKWLSESIKACILPTNIFIGNKRGFPTLSTRHQDIVNKLMRHKVQFIFKGQIRHEGGLESYRQYLDYLNRKLPPLSQTEQYEEPYFDYLQIPLQPLMDNLESQTYETFEKDEIKYIQYEKAVNKALQERFKEGDSVIVMVLGAGRGPLVRASLRAGEETKRNVRVYAVEKNPNAVVTLQNMKITLGWGSRVTIVHTDMRHWRPAEKADIIVSELLGSFGDNELSPECLDFGQEFLKEGGISIPAEYTSYLAPVTTSKLWNDVKSFNDPSKFETGYVVKLFAHRRLADPQPVFRFVHPNYEKPINNTREVSLHYHSEDSAVLHGFGGYFECILYGDVTLSTHPLTHTPEMSSWFPIYFPIRNPMYVPVGSEIVTHFWRCNNAQKVWYEWSVSSPDVSSIHNPNGRTYWIGL